MARKIRLGIVVCEFNWEITRPMLARALGHAAKIGAEVAEVAKVPGVFESPLAVKRMLRKKSVDAVVVLGAVVKGGTRHDELIARTSARAYTVLSLEFGKPVGLGVIGPGASWKQAKSRSMEYAERSVSAAVKMAVGN